MSILDAQGAFAKVPKEQARRLFFDNDDDQDCFRIIYNALAFVEDGIDDIRMMFLLARLFSKLERFSVAAPEGVTPVSLKRRQRMLPPYPGHPVFLDLLLPEMALIELALQLVPWGLEDGRLAARAYEFMLRSELVELDAFRDMRIDGDGKRKG